MWRRSGEACTSENWLIQVKNKGTGRGGQLSLPVQRSMFCVEINVLLTYSSGRASRQGQCPIQVQRFHSSHSFVCYQYMMHNLSRPPPASRRPLLIVTSTLVANSREHLTLQGLQEPWIHRKTASFTAIARSEYSNASAFPLETTNRARPCLLVTSRTRHAAGCRILLS